MKLKDIIILVVLFGLWMAWPTIDRQIIRKRIFKQPVIESVQPAKGQAPAVTSAAPAEVASKPVAEQPALAPATQTVAAVEEVVVSMEPEQTGVLENALMKVTISSRGASVASAELKNYRRARDPKSAPVQLTFSGIHALTYSGLAGLSEHADFAMQISEDRKSAQFECTSASGCVLRRTMTLTDGYMLKVTDELENKTGQPLTLPVHSLQLGSMSNLEGEAITAGMVNLGVDVLPPGGEKVRYWGAKIPKWFNEVRTQKSLPKLPVQMEWPLEQAMDWVAVKNKYFAQILIPEGGGAKCVVYGIREVPPQEVQDPNFQPKAATVKTVYASMAFDELPIAAGDTFTRSIQYYVGPKKYSELHQYGMHLVDVMEFGMWAPVGKILLQVLNWLYSILHSYGIAIILLTIIVRIVFWPITRKSTESMKKMQAVQPLVNAARAKYKDNAQKQQQEIMAIYKENKVNPLGGCLPMLVQIPVFIALYVVLRSAIELRFAPFLWIRDLSLPENLLAGVLPIPLNILPIFMAATMAWQQKLTPSAGDAAQQKMMMLMPVMMLFLFYNMASGLVLYWSTSQVLMIAQQLMMQRKKAKDQLATAVVQK